jgi:putative transposase
VRDHQAVFPVATMCRVLRVSASGFYAWRARRPSARATQDAVLLGHLRVCHARSDGTYGAPRLQADLRDLQLPVGQKRVARLMRQAGLVGVCRRRGMWHCERRSLVDNRCSEAESLAPRQQPKASFGPPKAHLQQASQVAWVLLRWVRALHDSSWVAQSRLMLRL